MKACEFVSAVVDEPAKLPAGGSDISPPSAVEPSSRCLIQCSYCRKQKPKFQAHASWCEKVFRKIGVPPSVPLCASCAEQLVKGHAVVKLDESDLIVKNHIESLKRRAHLLSIRGGSLDELRDVISELQICSHHFLSARQDFQIKSNEAAAAAAKVEWIRKSIEDAKEVIERKTSTTYEFCRNAANKAISNPEVRAVVFARSGNKCEACGSSDFLSVDHIKPVKQGGTNTLDNYQCLCMSCNCKKGAK